MKKICFVLTTDIAVKAFLINHLRSLSDAYEITIMVGTDHPDFLADTGIQPHVIALPIARKINFISDIHTLYKLIIYFLRYRFDALHSVTPKAGLLSMLAGFITRIPVRTHTFTGQVWVTKTGLPRAILKAIDKFLSALSTHLIIDSPSQRDFLLRERVIHAKKSVVFGEGSIAGVDTSKFKPDPEARRKIRSALGVPEDVCLFLFLGRLNRDKGVIDLALAFINAKFADARLLFVGPDEQAMQAQIEQIPEAQHAFIHFVSYTNTPERYMAAADVLCLPSYREGFGSVIIEAASCGIPAVASRIYGITDAVLDGQTGLLHAAGDVNAISEQMQRLQGDPALYKLLAQQAYQRATSKFDSKMITKAWCDFYGKVLA